MRRIVFVGMVLLSIPVGLGLMSAVRSQDQTRGGAPSQASASLEARNQKGQTALLVAVWENDLELAHRLIEAGADVNARDDIKDSPYLVAGAQGRTEILKLILDSGRADLESTNRYGGTALIPAAEKGHPEAVRLLIEAGVEIDHVNRLGWTALMETVVLTNGGPTHVAILKTLLDAGADPNIPDKDGITALTHARQRGFDDMVRLLEQHGAR